MRAFFVDYPYLDFTSIFDTKKEGPSPSFLCACFICGTSIPELFLKLHAMTIFNVHHTFPPFARKPDATAAVPVSVVCGYLFVERTHNWGRTLYVHLLRSKDHMPYLTYKTNIGDGLGNSQEPCKCSNSNKPSRCSNALLMKRGEKFIYLRYHIVS